MAKKQRETGEAETVAAATPSGAAPTEMQVETATAAVAREPGDDAPAERKHAPDPFVFAGDFEAGVRLRESRRFRRSEIEFVDGKPSQPVLDQLKADGFRWSPDEKVWARPVGLKDAYATRVEAERTYKQVVQIIREEKGISRNPF
jgi:hypothetical protein